MVIFIGKQYWIYPNNEQGLGPYPLTNLGLPEDLEKLDGAMVWGHNGKTYFFSGTMYWRSVLVVERLHESILTSTELIGLTKRRARWS